MPFAKSLSVSCTLILLVCATLNAQQAATSSATGSPATAASATTTVPRLVNFSGKTTDAQGKLVTGVAGVTFSIYAVQYEGTPLWIETQNVTADAKGNYTVQLGATSAEGLPLDLFTSGEARWLGVRVNGGEEQSRVLLLSVPYALKAADAETVGGLPASAFMLAGGANAAAAQGNIAVAAPSSTSASSATSADVTTSGGTANTLPLFTTATNVQSSILTQTGSGTAGKIGFNTTTPATLLDVNGGATVRGTLALAATGTATATAGKNSQPLTFTSSSYNSSTAAAVVQKFQWQAESAANDTTAPSGTMNLLYASGTATPAETGLKINSKGQITFATGQTFPGSGGTITGVTAGTALTGGGTVGTVTLNVDTSKVPLLASSNNTFTGNQTVSGSVTAAEIIASSSADSVTLSAANFSNIGAGGIYGYSENGDGIQGDGGYAGVWASGGTYGVYASGTSYGVMGDGTVDNNIGVAGLSTNSAGVYGQSHDSGWAVDAYSTGTSTGLLAGSASGYAGWFNGTVDVNGTFVNAVSASKIDHPLDPANKYLSHSFVESPDMMNIYNGNAILDGNGEAVVTLPEWFETLNRDFRYQLTAVGAPGPNLYVAEEISGNHFKIAGGRAGAKVSWQVTGIRQDEYANAHRILVEQEKPEAERGFYLHPELFGAPEEKGILWATSPKAMQQWKEARANAAAATGGTPAKPLVGQSH